MSAVPPPREPVKPTALMRGSATSAAPTSAPAPNSSENTPSCRPHAATAACMARPTSSDVPGWAECPFTTTGQPAASAEAVSPPATEKASGKLLAPNTTTGPSGTWRSRGEARQRLALQTAGRCARRGNHRAPRRRRAQLPHGTGRSPRCGRAAGRFRRWRARPARRRDRRCSRRRLRGTSPAAKVVARWGLERRPGHARRHAPPLPPAPPERRIERSTDRPERPAAGNQAPPITISPLISCPGSSC